jgi:pimeloyl-ACP methyl ester carboxylesterase
MNKVLAVLVVRMLRVLLVAQLCWSSAMAQAVRSEQIAAPSASASAILPTTWRQFHQREPVFGSDVFWVETGTVGKPVVLLVHGLGQMGLRSLAPVITGLSRNYHVIAPDLPGFGFSGQPSGRYSPTNYARVLNWLLTEVGVGPVAVVGHSMGAAVALRFAASYPDSVERLVVVNAAGILQRTAFIQHVASVPMDLDGGSEPLAAGADTLRLVGRYLVEWSNFLPDTNTLLSTDSWIWKTFIDGQPSINAAMSLVEEDFSSAIAGLEADTYIIVGTDDPLSPPRTGRLLAGSLQHAQLFEMFGADHIPMLNQTELFMTLLTQTLEAKGVGEPYWQHPKRVWLAPDLVCDKQDGQRYSGYYKRVELRDCDGVLLENLSAESLHIVNSTAQVYNLEVRATPEVGISLENSDLELTNADIKARTAISSRTSRIDLAGLTMEVLDSAVIGAGENRLIVSVSELQSPDYQGYVHGSFKLNDSRLQMQLQ